MRGGRLSLKAQSLLPSDPYVDEEPSAAAVATSSGTRSAIACGVLGFVGGVVLTVYALHRKNAPRDDVAPTPPSSTHARLYDTPSPVMDTPEFVVAGRSLLEYIAHYRTAIVPGGASAPAAGSQPVRSAVEPGFLTNAAALASMPEEGADWPTIMKEFEALIAPGLTHWESPNFYAYFKPHSSYPSVLGEMLSAGLNVMGFSWNASPACTELESVTLDWLAQLIDLPAAFHCGSGGKAGDASGDGRGGKGGGVIQGSAGESCIVAMLAARARATALWKTAPHVAARNAERVPTLVAYARSVLRRAHVVFHLTTPCLQLSHTVSPFVPLPLLCSDQGHSIVDKACLVLGSEAVLLRKLPTSIEDGFALRPSVLRTAIAEDIAAGNLPFFVFATVATTSTCACDPLREIAALVAASDRHNPPWLHLDAACVLLSFAPRCSAFLYVAPLLSCLSLTPPSLPRSRSLPLASHCCRYGGAYAVCAEFRTTVFDGIELMDSIVLNCHKKLLVSFDCAAMWVRDRSALLAALSLDATKNEYLRNAASDSGAVIDYKDWQLPLGRRFRALKLYFVLKSFGAVGLRAHIRNGVRLAQRFEDSIDASSLFQVVAKPKARFALVCFRLLKGGDEANELLRDMLNDAGEIHLIHTRLNLGEEEGVRTVLRLAIGGLEMQDQHINRAFSVVRLAGLRVCDQLGIQF